MAPCHRGAPAVLVNTSILCIGQDFVVTALISLIAGRPRAIETKATEHPSDKHLKGLRSLMEEGIFKHHFLECLTRHRRMTEDGIVILNRRDFLQEMWRGEWQDDGKEYA
jgi:hypothetical protein